MTLEQILALLQLEADQHFHQLNEYSPTVEKLASVLKTLPDDVLIEVLSQTVRWKRMDFLKTLTMRLQYDDEVDAELHK